MQTLTIEKGRGGYRRKTNHNKKKKRIRNTSKNEEGTKTNDVDKEVRRNPKRISEDKRSIFTSAIDPYDAPLTWWEAEPVRYAINYLPVRFRLEKIMGTHVVRLTDRKYMLLLMAKLYENHVQQQQIRIEERKLSPPSIIRRLLELSYKILTEKLKDSRFKKLNLYV